MGAYTNGHADTNADSSAHPREALTAAQLLALQLYVRGYTPAQIATLRTAPVPDVVRDLQRIVWALGVGTLGDAIAAARHRGLIL